MGNCAMIRPRCRGQSRWGDGKRLAMKCSGTLVVAGLLATGILVAGCSDDNGPTNPNNGGNGSSPSSANAAVDNFAFALAQLDSNQLQQLLTEDFALNTGRNSQLVGTDVLDRDRVVRALSNLCVKEPAQQPCFVNSISVAFWSSTSGTPHRNIAVFRGPRKKDTASALTSWFRIAAPSKSMGRSFSMRSGNLLRLAESRSLATSLRAFVI